MPKRKAAEELVCTEILWIFMSFFNVFTFVFFFQLIRMKKNI